MFFFVKKTGISPSMTYIGFYIASTNLFYGYCYQGKHYCSYDIQKDLSTAISEDDYIALLGMYIISSALLISSKFMYKL